MESMKKNPGIAKTLKEVSRLLSGWGLKDGDYALFGEQALKLQGFKIKARENHLDIGVFGRRLPWKVRKGEEATVPPKNSEFFKGYISFTKKTGCDLHLIPLPLADLSPKNLKSKTFKYNLPGNKKIRVIKLIDQIENYYHILFRLAEKERWADEKMKRWLNYFYEFNGLAEKMGDKDVSRWCAKGLKLAQKKKKAVKSDNNKQADSAGRAGSILHGRGIFQGRAKGKVRIITKDSQLKKVRWGEVLVMRHATPGVAIVLHRINAIVTDEGGVMSHAAILSREHKIPAVIATHNATKVLKDGDYAGVDGRRGRVEIIKLRKTKGF